MGFHSLPDGNFLSLGRNRFDGIDIGRRRRRGFVENSFA
jgi:hypothetical protein